MLTCCFRLLSSAILSRSISSAQLVSRIFLPLFFFIHSGVVPLNDVDRLTGEGGGVGVGVIGGVRDGTGSTEETSSTNHTQQPQLTISCYHTVQYVFKAALYHGNLATKVTPNDNHHKLIELQLCCGLRPILVSCLPFVFICRSEINLFELEFEIRVIEMTVYIVTTCS